MSRQFTVIDVAQGSPAWHQARCGRLTASRAKDVLATIKTGEAAARRDYRVQLCVERLTGISQDQDGFVNADMQRGTDLEPEAFTAYQIVTGQIADRCGFVAHNDLMVGVSPDGVIDDFVGLVELKVPRSATHLRYLRGGGIPTEHLAQITCALWVTGAGYLDFLSYDPRFPPALQTFYRRVLRDEVDLKAFDRAARMFLDEVASECDAVATMANPVAVLREVAHAV